MRVPQILSASAFIVVAHVACSGQSPTGVDSDAEPALGGDAATDVAGDATLADASTDAPEDPAAGPDTATETGSDGAHDSVSDAGLPEGGALAAVASCTPEAPACSETPVLEGLWASYRKDSFFADDVYLEYTDPPVDGGRFHIVGVAAASGPVSDVRIDGVSVAERLAPPSSSIEWYHVWPDPVIDGAPLWVTFHSRDSAWDEASTGSLVVDTAEGVALSGDFDVQATPGPITWVTRSADERTLLVHVHNDGETPLVVDEIAVNGSTRFGSGVACAPDSVVAPGESALLRVPLCEPLAPGSGWTVVVQYRGAPAAVAAGRVLRSHFVVEAWPRSSDCPTPTSDGTTPAFDAHVEAGFDTLYLYWGGGPPRCPTATPDIVNDLLPARGGMFALIGDDYLDALDEGAPALTNTSQVAGFLTGDESDGEVYDAEGRPNPEHKASAARTLWALHPEVTVYNGAKTNGHVGTFAGMTDVQGMDLYIAACAPHITEFGHFPPMRAAYDYLRNARDNHMPLPTWLYSQGLSGVWNWGSDDDPWHIQPDPQEIFVQAMSVVAAGGKGIMWFQTAQEEAEVAPERWDAISRSNWMIRSVRRLLYEGDVTSMASTTGDAIVEAIRGPDAIVVPVINLAWEAEVTDIACAQALFHPETPPHWILADQRVDVDVVVPTDQAVVDVFEVTAGLEIAEVSYGLDTEGRRVVVPNVHLDNDVPVRLFVLAASETVRAEVAANLIP